jgi:hypothetical protein
MTLIELIVAMAVTSIVLVGLTSVLYSVSNRYQSWVDRVGTASIGFPLAASLQADSHRYVPCNGPRQHDLSQLDFCFANDRDGVARVRYAVGAAGPPYSISRQQLVPKGATVLMARSQGGGPPSFWFDCAASSGAVSGHVHVYNFRQSTGSSENFSVYYRAPWQQACA